MTNVTQELIDNMPDSLVKKIKGSKIIAAGEQVAARPSLVAGLGNHFTGETKNVDPKKVLEAEKGLITAKDFQR